MVDVNIWTVFLDWLPIILSTIAIIVTFYFSWGKYKLKKESVTLQKEDLKVQKYNAWLNEINPEPHINIWDGKVELRYKRSRLGDATEAIDGVVILAKIANSAGVANEPKWIYRLHFENEETYIGRLSDYGISIQIGITHHTLSFIPAESQIFHLESDIVNLENLPDFGLLSSLEIWVIYDGKKNTTYKSYQIFKYKNKEWTNENRRTKVWRGKKRQSIRK